MRAEIEFSIRKSNISIASLNFTCKKEGMLLAHLIAKNSNLAADS